MKFYKPLPDCLTIKQSNIEGLGLFSTENINKETNLGITHVKTDKQEFDYGFIRTPLGGFFNHSESPNCRVEENGDFIYLITNEFIPKDSEILAKYTLYDPTSI